MNAEIPDKIVAYNIYTQGTKIGITGKVDTPEFKMKTSTISGAGIGGEVDSRPRASGRQRSTRFRLPCWAKTLPCCCSRAWMCSLSIAAQRRLH